MRHWLAGILDRIHHWLVPKKANHYGWVRQRPDHRDHKYAVRCRLSEALAELPPSVDLRAKLPACWDQGDLGMRVSGLITRPSL